MTEHEALEQLKDIMQVFIPEDSEDLEQKFYSQSTIDDLFDAIKEMNGLVGEIKLIIKEVDNGSNI